MIEQKQCSGSNSWQLGFYSWAAEQQQQGELKKNSFEKRAREVNSQDTNLVHFLREALSWQDAGVGA